MALIRHVVEYVLHYTNTLAHWFWHTMMKMNIHRRAILICYDTGAYRYCHHGVGVATHLALRLLTRVGYWFIHIDVIGEEDEHCCLRRVVATFGQRIAYHCLHCDDIATGHIRIKDYEDADEDTRWSVVAATMLMAVVIAAIPTAGALSARRHKRHCYV